MEVVAQVITAGGIVGLIGLILRWMLNKVLKMEKKHCSDLYTSGHQPRYVTAKICDKKFSELKQLLIEMDRKREDAKDQFMAGQQAIETRLTAIETKLEIGCSNAKLNQTN